MTEQFATALSDLRFQPSVMHGVREMVRMRIFGILADYPDQNDHDVLRSDPIFKLIAGKSPDGDDLASQPTLRRNRSMPIFPPRRSAAIHVDSITTVACDTIHWAKASLALGKHG